MSKAKVGDLFHISCRKDANVYRYVVGRTLFNIKSVFIVDGVIDPWCTGEVIDKLPKWVLNRKSHPRITDIEEIKKIIKPYSAWLADNIIKELEE